VLVERDRRRGDEAGGRPAPSLRVEGDFRREVNTAQMNRGDRSAHERQVAAIISTLLFEFCNEPQQLLSIARRHVAGQHECTAHNRTVGVVVPNEWQWNERDMRLVGRTVFRMAGDRCGEVLLPMDLDQRAPKGTSEIGRARSNEASSADSLENNPVGR
jgi:hypothetical protein